jgi:hypothetical protein
MACLQKDDCRIPSYNRDTLSRHSVQQGVLTQTVCSPEHALGCSNQVGDGTLRRHLQRASK